MLMWVMRGGWLEVLVLVCNSAGCGWWEVLVCSSAWYKVQGEGV